MAIGVGSVVRSKVDCKVVKKEGGRVVEGEWVRVKGGDVGKVASILRKKNQSPIFRVKFRGGFVDVQRQHLVHIDGRAEEPLSREVMLVADPDFALRKDEGMEDAEY